MYLKESRKPHQISKNTEKKLIVFCRSFCIHKSCRFFTVEIILSKY